MIFFHKASENLSHPYEFVSFDSAFGIYYPYYDGGQIRYRVDRYKKP